MLVEWEEKRNFARFYQKGKKKHYKMKGKWVIAALLGCLLVVACLQKQGLPEQSLSDLFEDDEEDVSDSLEVDADTLLLDEELAEAPLPATADEVFDDFLFLFDHSNRVQRQRVRFPFPVVGVDGSIQEISRQDWTSHSMSLGQDFCTVLWNGRSQMDMASETTHKKAQVEHIYLHSRLVEAFAFERDSTNGHWMLQLQKTLSFDDYPLKEFLDFYREFATDSIYQRRHVQDPLTFSMPEEDSEEDVVRGTIDVDQWFEFAPDLPQAVLVNINYGQRYANPNRVIMQMRGFSDSMQNLFVFQRDANGRWRLTEFEN